MWRIELESIIEKLDSDYEVAKEETLCFLGAVYCAFESNSETFKHAIAFIERHLSNSDFFDYVLLSYENQEVIKYAESIDKIKDYLFTIEDIKIHNNCDCLLSHKNIISLSFIIEHMKKIKLKSSYGSSYEFRLKNKRENVESSTYNLQQIKSIKNKIDLFEIIEKLYYYPSDLNVNISDDQIKLYKHNYKYYHILNNVITQFNINKSNDLIERSVDVDSILQEYESNGVRLKLVDVQFSRYNLLSINEFTSIENHGPFSAVYDNRIKKKLLINTNLKLLNVFKELIDCGYIKNLALKPMSIINVGFGLESIERGAPLGASLKMLPSLSCFYGINYKDKLIVTHNKEKQEITFEELRDDYNLLDDGCVVTQVIHLKYEFNQDVEEYFIEHLDHEYILYDSDEYDSKENNYQKKGSKDKIKTFKIDNSKIPFFYKHKGNYLLLIILELYFLNKELLIEYFEKVTKSV